jgi:hypothetical protein
VLLVVNAGGRYMPRGLRTSMVLPCASSAIGPMSTDVLSYEVHAANCDLCSLIKLEIDGNRDLAEFIIAKLLEASWRTSSEVFASSSVQSPNDPAQT